MQPVPQQFGSFHRAWTGPGEQGLVHTQHPALAHGTHIAEQGPFAQRNGAGIAPDRLQNTAIGIGTHGIFVTHADKTSLGSACFRRRRR